MKGKAIIFLLVSIMLFVSIQVLADYNREVVVNAMRNNATMMGTLKAAAAEEDYFTAAEAFMGIAKSSKLLLSQNPPKGSKSEWNRIHSEVIRAAFRGIGACAEEDNDQLNVHLGEIGALMQQGHATFRK